MRDKEKGEYEREGRVEGGRKGRVEEEREGRGDGGMVA